MKFVHTQRLLLLLVISLGIYCLWIFSLPVFPTQDDAQHLYYVQVIRHITSGPSIFNQFYSLRFPLPPYTGQYVLLYFLTSLVNPIMAEKIMVCLILASTAFGFRFFALAIGKNGDLTALWITPLALSWPLFMGFHSFCLALSFSLWALGFWFRATATKKTSLFAIFLAVTFLTLMTHPVPVLFILAIVGGHILLGIVHAQVKTDVTLKATLFSYRKDLIAGLLAVAMLTYLGLFLNQPGDKRILGPEPPQLHTILGFMRLESMCFVTGGMASKLFRCVLLALLLWAIVIAGRRLYQRRSTWIGDPVLLLLIATLALCIVIPLTPAHFNGLDKFSERLALFIWISALAAASGTEIRNTLHRRLIVGMACLFSLFTLGMANRFIKPIAHDMATMEHDPLRTKYQLGLVMNASIRLQDTRVTFDSYSHWVGARYFRRMDALMMNDPWSNPPNILPIKHTPNTLINQLQRFDFEQPDVLRYHLLHSASERESLLSATQFILFVGRPQTGAALPDPLLSALPGRSWACTFHSWYFVCEATRTTSAHGNHDVLIPDHLNADVRPVEGFDIHLLQGSAAPKE